jgi:hypothetical protein
VPDWLADVNSAQLAVYPSSTGLAGGLLADAVIVAQTHQPEALRDRMKAHLLSTVRSTGDFKREVNWSEQREVKNVGTAVAYEVTITGSPTGAALVQSIDRIMFGPRGWRGFVKTTDDAVIMTFSQRPAVLEAAVTAAADPSSSLESSGMLRTMRQWMPAHRDIELYINVGQMSQMVDQVLATFGFNAEERVAIDPQAPPIGFALSAEGQSIETSLIIPAAVMAAAFDEAIKRVRKPVADIEPSEQSRDEDSGSNP